MLAFSFPTGRQNTYAVSNTDITVADDPYSNPMACHLPIDRVLLRGAPSNLVTRFSYFCDTDSPSFLAVSKPLAIEFGQLQRHSALSESVGHNEVQSSTVIVTKCVSVRPNFIRLRGSVADASMSVHKQTNNVSNEPVGCNVTCDTRVFRLFCIVP